MRFLAMSFLSTSCKIFNFSFLAMSKNRFLAMSFLSNVWHPHSWLYIPGYAAHENSNIAFLALSYANTREPIPGYVGYVECENP
jgi:hypothetical protein